MATLLSRSIPGARLRRLPSATTTSSSSSQLSPRRTARVESISRAQHLSPAVPAAPPRWNPAIDADADAGRAAVTPLPPTYFKPSPAAWTPLSGNDKEPTDPNKAKLGKTLQILQERMPTLLQSPLPQHILAPNISLRLFPSTYPHLPSVSGRVAYNAALWTSPIAWNRVPLVGNVRLEILAERVTTEPLTFLPRRAGAIPEQLVVRWSEKPKSPVFFTASSTSSSSSSSGKISDGGGDVGVAAALARALRFGRSAGGSGSGSGSGGAKSPFSGLFIFDFDAEGRVLTHTIETAQQSGHLDRGVGAKFVELTDWLLSGIRNPGETPPPVSMYERRRRIDDEHGN